MGTQGPGDLQSSWNIPRKQGKKSEKRQDMNNPGICAEFNRKWPNFTQLFIFETLKYFVWMTYLLIFKDFFDLIWCQEEMFQSRTPPYYTRNLNTLARIGLRYHWHQRQEQPVMLLQKLPRSRHKTLSNTKAGLSCALTAPCPQADEDVFQEKVSLLSWITQKWGLKRGMKVQREPVSL